MAQEIPDVVQERSRNLAAIGLASLPMMSLSALARNA
jgi:hypothetical protein